MEIVISLLVVILIISSIGGLIIYMQIKKVRMLLVTQLHKIF